ncbi:MAG: hypothetical protein HYT40_03380 [Candidatus Sungbacteria bacterium]|uniref:Uncharacterized protein n=1 Tax=Candidatus Sungiibacteriota bacterium TaxID=2750080 RepID=A0A931SDM9_9BACT|nr:hypothetical protein [Candidatus Sungbacteria bacterium]
MRRGARVKLRRSGNPGPATGKSERPLVGRFDLPECDWGGIGIFSNWPIFYIMEGMKSAGEAAVPSLVDGFSGRAALVLSSILLVFNSFALTNNWYRQMPLVDIPIHLIFGAVLALVFHSWRKKSGGRFHSLILVVLFTLAVGAFWELLEFLRDTYIAIPYGFRFAQLGGFDTAKDLLNNVIGGAAVSLLRIFGKR